MNTNTQQDLEIRWMIRRDMPEVLDIENDIFEFPWSMKDFIRCLRQRNCIGLVADQNDQVVGVMVYELHEKRLHVLTFGVKRESQRMAVGTRMAQKLIKKLSQKRRTHILLEVRETNLSAQFFFRQMGFKAVSVMKDFYHDTDEDAYLFRYDVRNAVMKTKDNKTAK